jgi:hypothetical protein
MPPGEEKIDIRREIDLLWNQGITVVRNDVKEVKADVKNLADSIASARRWAFGLIITAIPAYMVAIYAFVKR